MRSANIIGLPFGFAALTVEALGKQGPLALLGYVPNFRGHFLRHCSICLQCLCRVQRLRVSMDTRDEPVWR